MVSGIRSCHSTSWHALYTYRMCIVSVSEDEGMAAGSIAAFGREVALRALRESKEFDQVAELDGASPPVVAIRNRAGKPIERVVIIMRSRKKFLKKRGPDGNNFLNGYYWIPPKVQERHARAARATGAVLAWLTVQVDPAPQEYSCYFGYMSDLNGNSVSMERGDVAQYVQLAFRRKAPYDISQFVER